jgi:hypothetical protein
MTKNVEDVLRNYGYGTLRAFLENRKNLNWSVGMVRSSGVRGRALRGVFDNL